MIDERITASNIRKINRNRVYRMIWQEKTTSKFHLIQLLEMSLSTVSYNLANLSHDGLIRYDGYFESTGGRRAQQIKIDSLAKVAVGIGILLDRLHFVALDLYGEMIFKHTYFIPYAHDPHYYQSIGEYLKQFILNNAIDTSRILGVGIATQGIVSRDGSRVEYGTLIHNSEMTLDDFRPYIPFPLRMEHDSKAAGNLILWNNPDIRNGILLLLNQSLGSAIIANRTVQWGDHMRSGLIEHTCIHPDGPLCYCGKRGCLDTYCSAQRLEKDSGMDIPTFFSRLREADSPELRSIWLDYLNKLAFVIRNLSVTFDGVFILAGYLAPYITRDDISLLLDMINTLTPWPLSEDQLRLLGKSGQFAPARGAALHYISSFIESV